VNSSAVLSPEQQSSEFHLNRYLDAQGLPPSPAQTASAFNRAKRAKQVLKELLKGVERNAAPARLKGSHRKQKCPNHIDSGTCCGVDETRTRGLLRDRQAL
jgi:hypothetical protein